MFLNVVPKLEIFGWHVTRLIFSHQLIMSSEGSINQDLLVRSINYHGQQLTGFLQERPVFRNIDLGSLDYHLYHQRSRELRIEDRGRRMLLNRFIAQNVDGLFDVGRSRNRSSSASTMVSATAGEAEGSDVTSVVPPIETFMRVGREDRTRHFFDTITEGDVLFAKVSSTLRSFINRVDDNIIHVHFLGCREEQLRTDADCPCLCCDFF